MNEILIKEAINNLRNSELNGETTRYRDLENVYIKYVSNDNTNILRKTIPIFDNIFSNNNIEQLKKYKSENELINATNLKINELNQKLFTKNSFM